MNHVSTKKIAKFFIFPYTNRTKCLPLTWASIRNLQKQDTTITTKILAEYNLA